jgi:hypothetical protein
LEKYMKPKMKLLITLSLVILFGLAVFYITQGRSGLAQAESDQSQVIQQGLEYLQTQQQSDGGIAGYNGSSDPDTTARSIMAFSAARAPISEVVSAQGNSMLDYLASQTIGYTHDTTGTLFPGRAGIILTAVALAGGDGTSFGGMDLVGELETSLQPNTGAYSSTAMQGYSSGEASDVSQAWAILGLSLDGNTIPEVATNYLMLSQSEDGSWGAGDPDTTALVMTALLASQNVGNQRAPIQQAIAYFHATQAPSAGWKPSWDADPTNADSTGWILQALITAGEDLRGQSWMVDQSSPGDALMSLQKPDGSIGGTYANAYSTAEAIIGLAGIPLTDLVKPIQTNQAGLAVFYGDDQLSVECISFTGSNISGLDLLERSGLDIQTATNPNQGTAVCKIGAVGSPSEDCFGSMPNYWSYWTMGPTGWEYSAIGVEQSKVMNGSLYAWSWGEGNPPAKLTFQNICEGVPYELPTSTPTDTPDIQVAEPMVITAIAPTGVSATQEAEPAAPSTNDLASQTDVSAQEAVGTPRITTSYIIYGSIVIVLGVLIILLIRSHNR